MSKLLFVGGFPSGGTDLLKTIINTHPLIYINGEMPFLKNLTHQGYHKNTIFTSLGEIQSFQHKLKKIDIWDNMENIDHDFSSAIRERERLRLEEVIRTCFSQDEYQIWGNKTPQNTENINTLLSLFPKAYFLIITRDIRDVCLSWRNKWGKDVLWCADKWAKRMQMGIETTSKLTHNRYLFVKFEELITKPENSLMQICAFLDIPFSERMLEHHKYTNDIIDGKINYGQPISKNNQGKWKEHLSSKEIRRIEEIAFTTMAQFHYNYHLATKEKEITAWESLRGFWIDAWATLFIGNRASQRNNIGQRLGSIIFEFMKRKGK